MSLGFMPTSGQVLVFDFVSNKIEIISIKKKIHSLFEYTLITKY